MTPPRQDGHRVEHDLLGRRDVPADAYYGVHTLRAVENFPITGIPLSAHPELVRALAAVKLSAARANRDLGLLPGGKAAAIEKACSEILDGRLHDQFVVDVVQGGAGTSSNMNANEVIANRALEHLGHDRGDYRHLHPLEDVNAGQSTNDVYPTAVKIALHLAARRLSDAMEHLGSAFAVKAAEFDDVLKVGRTQLQDAVPMSLGREFGAYAVMLAEDRSRLSEACALLHEINLGGTAIGTGLNAHPDYPAAACEHLAALLGIPLSVAPDLVEATQDAGAFVQLSGVLKRIAVKLSKTCNDLRLLASGPRAGLGEITLPAVQAGSSIMPGKVNPVIPEVVNQVAFEVIGGDLTVTMAAEAGQLQLNAFEPIIAHRLLSGLAHMGAACRTLADRCVAGITTDREHLARQVERSIGLATALSPHLGYEQATAVATEALATGAGVAELVLAKGLLTKSRLREIQAGFTATGTSAAASPR
ncbi:aspartate ammonia-lyase [Nocardiopsis sp. CC223A]|uniref:aspartate ammonia-lyase n=1 Tax=Nocardiopsis sp. CC223A TaxID=3044051 RepID=UPI00278C6640|nr:aspartate ammonia-lyase [Nocardiopsis sp. CC223A]